MSRSALLLTTLLILSIIPALYTATENVDADVNWTDISIAADDYHEIDLGTISSGKEVEIDYSADDNIDVLLMTSTEWAAWQSGSTGHTASGSDYDDSSDSYVYTIETTAQYYLVLDNSDEPPAGADSTGSTVIASGDVTIVNASTDTIRTRAWLDQNTESSHSLGSVNSGEILGIDLSCDIGLTSTDDIDFLVMSNSQYQAHTAGTSTAWNSHATFLEVCSEEWEYETSSTETWWFILENGPEGDASPISEGIMVDVELSYRSLIPFVEVVDTTRMILAGEQWRIDLGYIISGETYNFIVEYDSSGTGLVLDDLDILVMETSEADDFTDGNSATILGHASGLNTGPIGETWDYKFPSSGYFSVIFDNSDEPQEGAGGGSAIHTEISINELTIPSLFGNIWTGWYQSRHLVEEDEWMAMDLGTLDSGDDLYYYIGNHNIGGSIWTDEYDVLLMDDSNYQIYVAGNEPTIISGGSNLEITEEIPVIQNWTASTTGDYWLVLDGADGPDDGADASGDWLFDFMVLTSNQSISSPQATNSNYELDVTNSGSNTPADTDNDGVPDYRDDCANTPSNEAADSNGCSPSQRDTDGDGVSDADDQCAGHDDNVDVDNDGVPDGCDALIDSDGDGVEDSQDQCEGHDDNVDADNDGTPDGCDSFVDSDGDGVEDSQDQCAGHDDNVDVDNDGTPDGCDALIDSDGDGISDNEDQCEGHDDNTDSDSDGIPDGCDTFSDSDGDGVEDEHDQCPGSNDQLDVDNDGIPDGCDSLIDSDSDGVSDSEDQCEGHDDNVDADNDGVSDGCDTLIDSDGDLVGDIEDQCEGHDDHVDIDGDGTPDGCDSLIDSDGDGISDSEDQCEGHDDNIDADNDGIPDGCDDVGEPGSNDDADNDGILDANDQCEGHDDNVDVDNDGTPDGCDSLIDSDGDGIADSEDDCLNQIGSINNGGCPPDSNQETEPSPGDEGLPGFGIVAALAVLGIVAIARRD